MPIPLSPIRHLTIGKMHTERTNSYYTPTSPLSPTMNPSARPISPQPARLRARQSPKNSKSMRIGELPRYHPLAFESPNETPGTNDTRPTSPIFVQSNAQRFGSAASPRLMRQYQRELLARADISSRIAASPFTSKPDAPRIDPANSPGPVTPLALEGSDYFTVSGRMGGPAESPGTRSEGSVKDAGEKANASKITTTKKSSPRR